MEIYMVYNVATPQESKRFVINMFLGDIQFSVVSC